MTRVLTPMPKIAYFARVGIYAYFKALLQG